ncbi:hypothetical protein TrLO_g11522 [Triparma laevis f. longispina]|uniref:Uncharacterized protein n=1 Tax=Triparma laevis f. longispina TaxID=1714387 RepID=A0A9W7C780_9STRA|nr:hypothetical protein TrLO_g11522 [Triparma laevis f. longispina]
MSSSSDDNSIASGSDSDNDSSSKPPKKALQAEPETTKTEDEDEGVISKSTFKELGVNAELCSACAALGWSTATAIQAKSLPLTLAGRDVIGLAETGSGKTGSFALPILQELMKNPQRLFACILAPTRELAFQIHEVFQGLGQHVGAKSICVVGGVDSMSQAIALANKPHIVVATPGRLVDHLENTKGFNLRQLKYLVMDEADRMLSMDFEEELNKILAEIPDSTSGRRTMLFSATMTSKVEKLQRASLSDPIRVEVSTKFQTPEKLLQEYLFIPAKYKDCYLSYIMNEFSGQSILVFASTCNNAQRLTLLLRNLGFQAVCLHGQMSQPKRLGALTKFKSGSRDILICTDVASRGLDIPSVDVVINFDLPSNGKDYIHRVGRTARAGRSGRAVAMVTQYDVEVYQRLEVLLGTKLPAYEAEESTVLVFLERVSEAQRLATREMKELMASTGNSHKNGKKRGKHEDDGKEGKMRKEARNGYGGGSSGKGGGFHNQRGGGNAKKKSKR